MYVEGDFMPCRTVLASWHGTRPEQRPLPAPPEPQVPSLPHVLASPGLCPLPTPLPGLWPFPSLQPPCRPRLRQHPSKMNYGPRSNYQGMVGRAAWAQGRGLAL